MSRDIRNLLFFIAGFAFIALPMLASAETIPATSQAQLPVYGYYSTSYNKGFQGEPMEVCTAALPLYGIPVSQLTAATTNTGFIDCWKTLNTVSLIRMPRQYYCESNPYSYHSTSSALACPAVKSCPAGQNWTLSGTTCMRPDCVAPNVLDPTTGVCGPPPCQSGAASSADFFIGRFRIGIESDDVVGAGNVTPSTLCDGSCVGSQGSIDECYSYKGSVPSPSNPLPVFCRYNITLTGASCTGNNGDPTSPPTVPSNAPPCAAGQGVIESGENVLCVDQGQAPNSDTPVVNKKVSTQTAPDGSQTITTVTKTCTGAGACSSTTNTTITPATGGAAGTSGTPGTTTKTEDKPSDKQAAFCAENPTLQICKGGMATEVLQKDTLDELKKITKPDVSDASSIEGKTFETTTGRDDLTTKDDELKSYASGGTVDGGVSGSKSAWESAMASGWFAPLELGVCTPFKLSFSGRTVEIDHCEKAALISQIGAYCMWIMLAISTFVMLTGGRNT